MFAIGPEDLILASLGFYLSRSSFDGTCDEVLYTWL